MYSIVNFYFILLLHRQLRIFSVATTHSIQYNRDRKLSPKTLETSIPVNYVSPYVPYVH